MSAPLDHVAPGYSRICVPPDGKPQIVCELYPDHCLCTGDCVDRSSIRRARRIVIALIAATAAIAAGLFYATLRFNWIFYGAFAASIYLEASLVHLVLR